MYYPEHINNGLSSIASIMKTTDMKKIFRKIENIINWPRENYTDDDCRIYSELIKMKHGSRVDRLCLPCEIINVLEKL